MVRNYPPNCGKKSSIARKSVEESGIYRIVGLFQANPHMRADAPVDQIGASRGLARTPLGCGSSIGLKWIGASVAGALRAPLLFAHDDPYFDEWLSLNPAQLLYRWKNGEVR